MAPGLWAESVQGFWQTAGAKRVRLGARSSRAAWARARGSPSAPSALTSMA